jgi:hypothetical protein
MVEGKVDSGKVEAVEVVATAIHDMDSTTTSIQTTKVTTTIPTMVATIGIRRMLTRDLQTTINKGMMLRRLPVIPWSWGGRVISLGVVVLVV